MRSIKEVQERLITAGFDVGPDGPDGIGGANTRAALARYQQSKGLPQTNRVDTATLQLLFPEDFEPKETPMGKVLGGLFSGLLGNLLDWQLVQSWLRSALYVAAGATGYQGLVGQDGTATTVAAILTIIGVVFSAISANVKRKALDVVKAADASPALTIIPEKESPVGKTLVVPNFAPAARN